jgi:hypothetical protein
MTQPLPVFGLLLSILLGGLGATTAEPRDDRDRPIPARETRASIPTPIVTRAQWGAKPALPGMKEQNVLGIIMHHTGVPQNPRLSIEAKMQGLQSFSQRPGQVSATKDKPAWPDIPYHFYIDFSGRIAE